MSNKENKKKSKSEESMDDSQLTIEDVNKIEDAEDKIEEVEVIEENSDADYIHDESIVSDDEFKKKLKEEIYKEKLKNKELYKQYKKDKKERKKANKDELKKITDKQARREFKIDKREEELNIRSDLGIKTKGERLSIFIKRTVLKGSLQTFLLILILIATYITINLTTQNAELPKIDVTAHKINTISKESKEYVANIEDDVKLYAYGFSENYYVCDLLKQYDKASDHITYEYLDGNSSPEIISKYNLLSADQTQVIIIESGTASKIIYSSDLTTYDSLTGDEIDLSENAITNGIYTCLSKNQPNIYYLTGHSNEKATFEQLYAGANATLTNNGFKIDELNILKAGSIPDDCDLIIIPSPGSDLLDKEAELIKAYIQKGGNLLIMTDYSDSKPISSFKNFKSIMAIYDSSIDNNGIIIEQEANKQIMNSTYFVVPTINSESEITKNLYDSYSNMNSNSFVAFYLPGKVILPSDESQEKNKLEVVTFASSSDNSMFIKDEKQTNGSYPIAAMITKTIKEGENESDAIKSKLVLIADSSFCSEKSMKIQNTDYPLSYIGKNIDLYTNSIAGLTDKEDFIKLRKPIYTATFTPTNGQDLVVRIIISVVPILIIAVGIIVKTVRKRRN